MYPPEIREHPCLAENLVRHDLGHAPVHVLDVEDKDHGRDGNLDLVDLFRRLVRYLVVAVEPEYPLVMREPDGRFRASEKSFRHFLETT
jgi:hypothetical protein